ncbi:LytR/AlgR family response regulator transcription factor [Ferruginibacter sp. HRS2-29]|uniref:LytR/AlgR family response regulator transcription factor n=1 Tax=Ferruginibacter sp. HRS2-29 TaxID=2487334 RepID=UPI0034E9590E
MFDDILYLEGHDDYVKIHMKVKKPVPVRMTLKKLTEILTPDFIRVQRSYIVNVKKITSVKGKSIFLGDTEIPIRNLYETEFFKAFKIK